MLAKKPRGHILMDVPYFESVLHGEICARFRCGHLTLKVLVLGCCALDIMHANAFQSVLHADDNTWADAGTLKVKYLVNAENFKRIL